MPETFQVAIVGGGISGLVCAHRLRGLGVRAVVLESEGRGGGVIGTVERNGFLFEAGPQSFLGTPPVLELIRELKLEGELVAGGSECASIRLCEGAIAGCADVAYGAAY